MQARIKETGAVITVVPKPVDRSYKFVDVITEIAYNWEELEPVKVKAGIETHLVAQMPVSLRPTITGTLS